MGFFRYSTYFFPKSTDLHRQGLTTKFHVSEGFSEIYRKLCILLQCSAISIMPGNPESKGGDDI